MRNLVAGAILIVSLHLHALDPAIDPSQYGHRTWGVDNGLPHTTVQAVAQTPDGYIWLATQEGLARFDGVHFTTFRPGIWFNALAVDRDGTLWAAGTNSGLITVRGGAITLVASTAQLGVRDVFSLAFDNSGALWLGTIGGVIR